MASSVIRFFKIVLRKSLEDGNLKVPKKFSKKYGDGVPSPVYLKPPDGIAWKIDWSEYDGEILFEKGWKEFASYYSLDNGHMLWFEYNQTSNMEVHILDMSGLEIDYPSLDHIGDDNSVEILNEPPRRGRGRPRKTKKAPLKTPSPCTNKMQESAAKTGVVKRSPELGYPFMDHIGDDNSVEVVNELPRRGRGRPRKTEKAPPKTPSPCTNKMLRSSAKTGVVKKCPEIDYPSMDHIGDNNKVEVVNEPPRRGRGRPRKKVKAAAEVSSPSTSKILSSSVKTRDVEKGPDKQNWQQCCKNEEASQSEETGLKLPTIQSARVDLDIVQGARKFKSKNPSFLIKIRQTQLYRSATSIPAVFFRKHFKKTKEYVNLHSGEKQWPVTLIYYPLKKSASLSSGWLSFARETNLKAGDICIFELVSREDSELHAHIFRRDA